MRTKHEREQIRYGLREQINGSVGPRDFGACIGERLCLDDVFDGAPDESGRLISVK
jgi:hypothetical protein